MLFVRIPVVIVLVLIFGRRRLTVCFLQRTVLLAGFLLVLFLGSTPFTLDLLLLFSALTAE